MELSEQAKAAKRQYAKEWRRNNPEKVKEYSNRFWERRAENFSIEQKARNLKADGMTQREISKALNISLGLVNKYVNKREHEY
ncbi:MAG: winged helix-turn-helix transcriptional regulator [Candidatus Kapabacteria bacterium]|nr:winged helix-turn-helix transcriptional regulator [Candidatus Kapabacteria bacterium]